MRQTVQKSVITDYLLNRPGHFTAQSIWQRLKKYHPRLSLGTVYRNLNELAEQKKINIIIAPNQQKYFDGVTSPHYHFSCTACRQIFDLPEKRDIKKTINKLIVKRVGRVTSFTINFEGQCVSCLKK